MKTLDRYLAGIFLKNFFLAALALTTLFIFQAFMGDLFNHSYPSEQLLVYHLLALPQVLVQMMPPAVLLATVLTLSALNRSNELTACHAIGLGIRRIVGLLLSIVFIVCCVILVMEDRILPPTFKKRTSYYWRVMKKRPDFFLDIKQDKIWYRSKNLIYNLQVFDTHTNTIRGMSVYTFDEDFNLVEVVDAEKASYSSQGWKLGKGTVTVFSPDDPFPLTKGFTEKDLIIPETPKDFREIEKEVDGLRLKELFRYIARVRQAGADTKRYEVNFHSKISLSFIPLVMCVLAVPFSVRNRREGGLAKDLGLCLGLTLFYWIFYSVGLSLGTNGALPPWLAAWLPSAAFAALAAGLIARRNS
ncbi:MAG: LPS export ABC transporter permease LptG [Oligoflexia bacterium]|nr:LPS export ABC transporter permease LptG [Oligoflexia bacterium]